MTATNITITTGGAANKYLSEDGTYTIPSAGSVAWGSVTGTLSSQTDLQTALDGKVDKNSPITGATKTKITYDAKGLVTAGVDATTADIADSTNRRYVTDTQLTVVGNTSGTNTGDQINITGNAATVTTINGRISAGTNIAITGSGTSGSPYNISALGAGGGVTLQTSNITINVPTNYATFDAAQQALNQLMPAPGIVRAITVTGHQTAASALGTFDNFFSPITVRGTTTPINLTFSSIGTITGSKGTWSVPITVSSATGVASGDVILMNTFTNSLPTQGGSGSYPAQGSFQYGISSSALSSITVSASAGSTSATLSSTVASSLAGYVIGIAGQFRYISSHTAGTNTITVSSAWLQDCSGFAYWYLLNPESGTVAFSGTTVTGTSTSFTSRVSPGDLIVALDGGQIGVVSSVGSNTSITLARTLGTVSAGAKFCIAKACWQHEGAFLVTNVTGNVITVTNTSHADYAPPSVGLGSCTMVALKDSLATSSGSTTGIIASGAIDMDNIALIGTGSTGFGVDAGSGSGKRPAIITLGSNTAIIGYNTGVYVADGSYITAHNAYFSAASYCNVFVTKGANADLDSAYMHGGASYNMLHDGGYAKLNRVRMVGSGSENYRTDTGATMYGDWMVVNGAAGVGLQLISSTIHFVGSQCLLNHGIGMAASRGVIGGATGSSFVANSTGVSTNSCMIEMDNILASGNTSSGVGESISMTSHDTAGFTWNGSVGHNSDKCNISNIKNSFITGNPTEGVLANSVAMLNANNIYVVGNSANDFYCVGGSRGYVQGYKGSPGFGWPLNRIYIAGSNTFNDTIQTF